MGVVRGDAGQNGGHPDVPSGEGVAGGPGIRMLLAILRTDRADEVIGADAPPGTHVAVLALGDLVPRLIRFQAVHRELPFGGIGMEVPLPCRPPFIVVRGEPEFRIGPLHMGPGKGRELLRGEEYLLAGPAAFEGHVGHDRVGDIMAGGADELPLVIAAVEGRMIRRVVDKDIGKGAAPLICRADEVLSPPIFRIEEVGRNVVEIKRSAAEQLDHGGDQHICQVGFIGSILGAVLRRILRTVLFVPVGGPFVPFALPLIGRLVEGIVEAVTEGALDAVVILSRHGRGVELAVSAGAAVQPPLGKVAPQTDVNGIGVPKGVDGVLGRHGEAGKHERIPGGVPHHGPLPRLEDIVFGIIRTPPKILVRLHLIPGRQAGAVTRVAGGGALQGRLLSRLGSRHPDQRVIPYRKAVTDRRRGGGQDARNRNCHR